MKTFLMMLLGFASGAIVAAGIFAFITVIGIIPRMAQRTGTEAYCRHYEDMITLGGLFGCLPMLTDLHVSAPPLVLGFIGAAVGIFVGVLAVSLAEVCYSVLMGLDSVALNCDVEIGGIDQLLNFQQCRDIMKGNGLVEEIALMTPILEGTSGDGRKMSKSYGNAIAVLEDPNEKFGKFMSIKDEQIMPYFRCFAFMNNHEKAQLETFINENPFEAKKQLASFFVSLQAKDITQGEKARAEFERKFSKKTINAEDCIEIKLEDGDTLYTALSRAKLMSNSELRRMFSGKAVRNIEDGQICDKDTMATPGKIRVGKRIFVNFV